MFIDIGFDTLKEWGISLADYERGGWGTAVGSFKVYNSVIRRFRKKFWVNRFDATDIRYVDPNDPNNFTEDDEFDAERCFNEVAITYVNAIVATYEILRKIKFYWLPKEIQSMLRKVVYNAIEYSALNMQFWENVNGSSISTNNFSLSVDQTAWLLTSDMLGTKAHNMLTNSKLKSISYYYAGDGFIHKTPKGNYTIIGKADLDNFPELK